MKAPPLRVLIIFPPFYALSPAKDHRNKNMNAKFLNLSGPKYQL